MIRMFFHFLLLQELLFQIIIEQITAFSILFRFIHCCIALVHRYEVDAEELELMLEEKAISSRDIEKHNTDTDGDNGKKIHFFTFFTHFRQNLFCGTCHILF